MRPGYGWELGGRTLQLGERTLVMGVVNVTPDSFYAGSRVPEAQPAVERGLQMLEEGADVLDIGGESTRPGARVAESGVAEPEELRRVLPVIAGIKRARPQAVLSVDTYKAGVARAAVAAGAEIVNDVSAFRWDAQMAGAVAGLGCGAILMHMRGRPEQWRSLPAADDIVGLVARELADWAGAALAAGVKRERIVLDPGYGFGKNFAENYPLLARQDELLRLGFPLLAGTSRKSFLGRTLARRGPAGESQDAPPEARLHATIASVTAAILKGAHIVRVHDVRPAVEAARIADAILAAGG